MAYYKFWYKWHDVRTDQIDVLVGLFNAGWQVYDKTVTKDFVIYILARPLT